MDDIEVCLMRGLELSDFIYFLQTNVTESALTDEICRLNYKIDHLGTKITLSVADVIIGEAPAN
jgi:hypothetical protein